MNDLMATAELVARARHGDGDAFGALVDPHRRELHLHCYRILGSVADAEDVLQETMLAAWQGIGDFRERSSVRTWLYRIATNRSLNALRSAARRPVTTSSLAWPNAPEPDRVREVPWLEPYPDVLLDQVADTGAGPEARYERSEAISLAFVTALQLLPPRQRAALVLRDVLGFQAAETAQMLETTTASVTGALQRARATLQASLPSADQEPAPAPSSLAEAVLVGRLATAFADSDIDGIVALLTEDVWLSMPPVPLEYQGRDVAAQALSIGFGRGLSHRLVATRANGQPAFGLYVGDPHAPVFHANGLIVVTLAGAGISALTRFDNSTLSRFGLPRLLPAARAAM
jgi:RNA polymerase sigma-70 factor (ECF subfamily)